MRALHIAELVNENVVGEIRGPLEFRPMTGSWHITGGTGVIGQVKIMAWDNAGLEEGQHYVVQIRREDES